MKHHTRVLLAASLACAYLIAADGAAARTTTVPSPGR
jgi:hypothetical protein